MSKRSLCLFLTASMVAVSSMAEQEQVITIQNHLRFGYDDNIYLDATGQESSEIIDVLNVSGKLKFSSRTDAVFSFQPELRYRFDADPDTISFYDVYGKLSHALSPRAFLTITDRMRYQLRDAQSGNTSRTDQNYLENDLNGAVDITVSPKDQLTLGGGYEFRNWDDDNYGEWNAVKFTGGNNYTKSVINGSYYRALNNEVTKLMLGGDYVNYTYDGDRGEFGTFTVMGGGDHVFSPSMSGYGRMGASFASTESPIMTPTGVSTVSSDNTNPYLDAGVSYKSSERTQFNAGMGYSTYRSENSIFNSQERFNMRFGLRHDLSSKFSVASSVSFIMSAYDGDTAVGGVRPDVNDDFFQFNLRGSYQINRNNFLEIGYEYTDRSTNRLLADFDRNRVDIGWRLKL